MAIQTLVLEGHTATYNELHSSKHWAVRCKLKKRDREWIGALAKVNGLVPATGKRRVSLLITLAKGKRRPDEDAWWKSILDSLFKAKMLVQDSPKWCKTGDVTYERTGKNGMVITLEDIE